MSKALFEHVQAVLLEDGFELVDIQSDGNWLVAVLDQASSVVVSVLIGEGESDAPCMIVQTVAGANIQIEDQGQHFRLLELLNDFNSATSIGKWYFRPESASVFVEHSMPLKGLGEDELTTVVRTVEALADVNDEDLVRFLGTGDTMRDALIEAAREEAQSRV